MARTNVTILDYSGAGQPPTPYNCTSSQGLKERIQKLEIEDSKDIIFRLIVSEDLSRDVIEILGSAYDVDPSFFREHLTDNIWYNLSRFFDLMGSLWLLHTNMSHGPRFANIFSQRTGGVILPISILSRRARIGSRCASHGPGGSMTRKLIRGDQQRWKISM